MAEAAGAVGFTLVVVMNPASTTAVCTALTEEMTWRERREIIRTVIRISSVVLVFFALTGQLIFSIFNITVPAFRIAVGILLVTVATGMLGQRTESYRAADLENIAVVPKLMAIIVLAIAVQFIISGIAEAMPRLLANVEIGWRV